MASSNYDRFLADVLRKEKAAFGFAANPDYLAQLPGELVWVLIRALVREKQLTLNQAARVVLDFTERKGKLIPSLLGGRNLIVELEVAEQEDKQCNRFLH